MLQNCIKWYIVCLIYIDFHSKQKQMTAECLKNSDRKADGFVQNCSNKERTQFYGRNGELPIRDSLHLSPLAKILQKIAEKQNKVGIIKMQLKSHQVEILFIINMMFFNSRV